LVVQSKVTKSLCQFPIVQHQGPVLIEAIRKESLSDSIARAVREMIDRQGLEPGHRLPTINDMARQFQVGAPTLREALRKLQAVGAVELRHGSGVYVAENHDALFVANTIRPRAPSRKVMIDLIDTRLAIETYVVSMAAVELDEETLTEMEDILTRAEQALSEGNLELLSRINMDFHSTIALASTNGVAHQVLDLLAGLFQSEQYAILEIYGSPKKDLEEHMAILEALRKRDPELAAERMKTHLQGVRAVLVKSNDAEIGKVSNS